MKYGSYMGRFLEIDLTFNAIRELELDDQLIEEYIGGKGFGVKLYQDYLDDSVEPLSSDNVLFFLTGPLTGTYAPAMRSVVVTRSPLTGGWLDSYFGGYFGQAIKYAGYDGLIIKGKADHLSYILIDNGKIEIKSGIKLKHLSTSETAGKVKKLHGDKYRVASIGPAGEELVKYSLISCENNRQAGRGGAGAVMGSKNLKAIAVKGESLVEVADKAEFVEAVNKANQDLAESADIDNFRENGTPSSVPFANEIGMLPTENYYKGQFVEAEGLETEPQEELFWNRNLACSGCPIACGKIGRISRGKYNGLLTDTVEYETLGLLGSNLGLGDIREVTKLGNLCDQLGLDTISAGGAVGFLIEAIDRNLYSDPELEALDFGNAEAIREMIELIAFRKGRTADLLAEGVEEFSDRIVGGDKFAIHIKGLETPAWPPRGAPGMGLALMTADRGGCHQRAFPVTHEVAGLEWQGKKLERLSTDGKASLVVYQQNKLAALDTLVKCDFGTYGISEESYQLMLEAATGLELDGENPWQELGARIWDQARKINIMHGFTKDDDTLPARFMEEPLPDGPAEGHMITEEDREEMLSEYYRLRGWSSDGEIN
ncbi:MAG: aldehyde ferredoxin oxidoreductase family protein [Halarsenatibacteraceae bacterium]